MKKILSVLLLVVMLCACDSSPIRDGRALYKEYLNKVYKDPSSIVIHSEKYVLGEGNRVDWTLDVGGKNSFGAMSRSTHEIKTFGRNIIEAESRMYSRDDLK
ncbi:hypothetical protein FACS189451_09240 [Bacteroidia bacterium]|nr:hypothetical protein FACS189451_09240 [Bacteroidia bacterium]